MPTQLVFSNALIGFEVTEYQLVCSDWQENLNTSQEHGKKTSSSNTWLKIPTSQSVDSSNKHRILM